MRYAYIDLGQRREGCTAVVRWGGSPASVMLFDPVNFAKYVRRLPSSCDAGGRYRRSPARISIPQDGRWYTVVDLGGHSSGRAPVVEVIDPEEPGPPQRAQAPRSRAQAKAERQVAGRRIRHQHRHREG